MRRYAICRKAELFELFDQGKRPSDIRDSPVTRKTLYQYYSEWRREKGVKGKETGFAIKAFDRKAYLAQERVEECRKSKEKLMAFVRIWEAMLVALEGWDGVSEKNVYISGKGYCPLSTLLRLKRGPKEGTYIKMTREENIALFAKWVELGKKASDLSEFKKLCHDGNVGYPSEIGS